MSEAPDPSAPVVADLHQGSLNALSNAMVRLYKEQFGRGPTRAKAAYADANTLVCTLEESMTPAEHNLIAMGEQKSLEDTRQLFQHASRREFVAEVEEITGRKVRAFVSGMDAGHDVCSKVFYLEPGVADTEPLHQSR